MGQLSTPWPIRRTEPRPWLRLRHRTWARVDGHVSISRLFTVIPSLPRAELARLTTRMIDRMDEIDGDTDVELNGDELDGSMGEDDFHSHNADWLGQPGCPISDPGEDDEKEDAYD